MESNLAEVGGAFLPGNRWCPSGSHLLKEISKPDCQSNGITSVSAASFSRTALAADSIASAFGQNLAVTTTAASSFPLPTLLAGTTVRVKDIKGEERLAPLFYVSPTQINYVIPTGTAPGIVTGTVTNSRGEVTTGTEMIMQAGPGLFTADATGKGLPAALALRVRNGQAAYEPIVRYDPEQLKFVPIPIDLGPATDQVFLVLFGTGFRHQGQLPDGVAATISGEFVDVLYAGAQPEFTGLDQINLPISRKLIGKGEVEVKMRVDDKLANSVRINIK